MMTCSRHNQIKFWGTRPCAQIYWNANSWQKASYLHSSYFLRYLECLSFEISRCRPFWYVPHKNLRKTRESKRQEILMCLIKLVRLRISSQHKVLSFSCWPLEGFGRTQRGWKDSERLLSRENGRIQRGLYYKQFPTRSSFIRRQKTKTLMWIMELQKIS